jgi:hypothetical protein
VVFFLLVLPGLICTSTITFGPREMHFKIFSVYSFKFLFYVHINNISKSKQKRIILYMLVQFFLSPTLHSKKRNINLIRSNSVTLMGSKVKYIGVTFWIPLLCFFSLCGKNLELGSWSEPRVLLSSVFLNCLLQYIYCLDHTWSDLGFWGRKGHN